MGDLAGISGDDFFQAKTEKINLLKEVEDFAAVELLQLMQERQAKAGFEALLNSVLALLVIAFSIVAAWYVARFVRVRMLAVSNAATELSEGNLDAELPKATTNEIGAIVTALDRFRTSILNARVNEVEMRQKEREAEDTKRAREAELEEERRAAEQHERETERARLKTLEGFQKNMECVLGDAALGDFSNRMSNDSDDAALVGLAEVINRLLEETETNIEDVVKCIGELSQGNLGIRIDGDRNGAFLRMKDDFNAALEALPKLWRRSWRAARTFLLHPPISKHRQTICQNVPKRLLRLSKKRQQLWKRSRPVSARLSKTPNPRMKRHARCAKAPTRLVRYQVRRRRRSMP